MFTLVIANRIARLTLDQAPVNAIGPQWAERLGRHLDELDGRDDWTVLHIRSALKAFCAGMDLAHAATWLADPAGPENLRKESRLVQALFTRLAAMDRPTIAEIGGAALGGGLELALACDLRIAADTAKLGLPEVGLGVIPAFGGTQRLAKLCGPAVAARLILGAEIVSGAAACEIGLAQWVVPATDLPAAAAALADRIAGFSRPALTWAKRCLGAAFDPQRDGYAAELDGGVELARSDEARQAILAFAAPRRD